MSSVNVEFWSYKSPQATFLALNSLTDFLLSPWGSECSFMCSGICCWCTQGPHKDLKLSRCIKLKLRLELGLGQALVILQWEIRVFQDSASLTFKSTVIKENCRKIEDNVSCNPLLFQFGFSFSLCLFGWQSSQAWRHFTELSKSGLIF